mgnify:CR=1 FL=1
MSNDNKEKKTITVKVNENPVAFTEHKVTGLQIKETAINQGVSIQLDFNLFEVKNSRLNPIADGNEVNLHKGQEFRAVTPDDNS